MSTKRTGALLTILLMTGLLGGCFLLSNHPPEARFEILYNMDPQDAMVIWLDATSSVDPDEDVIVSYSWAFDGEDLEILSPQAYSKTTTEPLLKIRLPSEGSYPITLQVRDEHGEPSEFLTQLVIVSQDDT